VEEPVTPEDPTLERARKHVTDVRDFYYHLMTYVLVNAMLIVIDLRVDGPSPFLGLDWAYWVIIGWGFGIAGHGIAVFFGEHRVDKVYAKFRNREP
jgi:hypothetical protein